jgi:type VI secretion system ImpC/EvpB family protein/type VI secretion system ImpB/VipA family protein
MLAAMAGETKGFMGGSMKFGVGEELSADEKERGPLLPLRLLVVTDLVPRDPYNAGASAPEGVIRVDPASFDDLFTRLRPRLAIEVPSVLAEGRQVRVDLSPTSLKSFRPDGLLAEVPLLRALLDGRMVLERLRDGQVSPEQAQQELHRLWSGSPFAREILGLLPSAGAGPGAAAATAKAAPAPAAAPANAPSVDSLLDMVDLSAPTATAPAEAREAPPPPVQASVSKFADLIATVARAGKTSTGVRPTEAVSRVEKAIGAQIGAILQHPEVRRLEQAYRGLRFITERAQGHTGVRFDVINARPDDMADALVRAIRANASSEPPVSCAVVELTVDGSAIGFSRLEAVANAAEAHNVPVLVNGSPRLLGVADLAGVEGLDNKGALFAAPQQAPWRAAVAKPALRWAAIALNGVLARGPYDKNTSRVREAVVKELPDDEGAWVFLAPAYAVATLVLQSFRETGWPCRVLGAKSGGIVENLPVHHLAGEHDGAEGIAVPTEVFLSTDTQRELGKSGVLALASAPNSDAAYVLTAPTAYVTPPKRTYDSATSEPEVRLDRVSLGDQLFVARLVQFLRALCGKLPPTIDPAEAQELVQGALWALFEDAKPGSVELAAKGARGEEGTVVQVMVRPRRFLGVQIEEIALEMPLG